MAPIVRVDNDVYEELKKMAIPFEDTPNSVLRRLLALDSKKSTRPMNPRKPAMRGSGTRKEEYEIPILESVQEFGGSARSRQVLEKVFTKMQAKLKQHDHDDTSDGESIWRNTARWAKKDLVEKGLLQKDSAHGQWEITEKGRDLLRSR